MQVLKLWRLPYAALISLAEDVVRGAFVRVDFQCHKRCCVHRGTRTPTFSVPVASIGVESLPVISFVARFVQVTLTGLDFPLGVFSFTLNPSAESALSACSSCAVSCFAVCDCAGRRPCSVHRHRHRRRHGHPRHTALLQIDTTIPVNKGAVESREAIKRP